MQMSNICYSLIGGYCPTAAVQSFPILIYDFKWPVALFSIIYHWNINIMSITVKPHFQSTVLQYYFLFQHNYGRVGNRGKTQFSDLKFEVHGTYSSVSM